MTYFSNVSFLISLNEYSFAKYEIACSEYNLTLGENLVSLKEVDPVKWESFLLLIDLNPKDFDHQKQMIQNFIVLANNFYMIAGYTCKGISLLLKKDYYESLGMFHHALLIDDGITPVLSRRKTISKFVSVACDYLHHKVEDKIFLNPTNEDIERFDLISKMISISFDIENEEIYQNIKKRFFGIRDTIRSILTIEQNSLMDKIFQFYHHFNPKTFERKSASSVDAFVEKIEIKETREEYASQLAESNSKIELFLV
jgi:hypothetical protein